MGGEGRGAKLSGKDDNKEKFKNPRNSTNSTKGVQELRLFFEKSSVQNIFVK
jgi:hypothetical protein